MAKKYYAIEWAMGRMVDSDGLAVGEIRTFADKKERQKWVDEKDYIPLTSSGAREVIKANDFRKEIYG